MCRAEQRAVEREERVRRNFRRRERYDGGAKALLLLGGVLFGGAIWASFWLAYPAIVMLLAAIMLSVAAPGPDDPGSE